MKKFKIGVLSMMLMAALMACSKSKSDDVKNDKDGTGSTPISKNNDNVVQSLINNFKGSASLIKQTETNDVVFGLAFVSDKAGAIDKIRAYTGQEREYQAYLWKKTGGSWSQVYQTTITTQNATTFSGEKDISWLIENDVEYRIGIRIKKPATGDGSVIRLNSSTNNISNGEAKIGSLTFEKKFYYKIHYSGSGQATGLPEDVGTHSHFAGMLDFDFLAN